MSFTTLYQRLSPVLKRIACSYQRAGFSIDQDDLFQEMSIHLWKNFKDGPASGINDAYIVQGCKFHIFNYLRKNTQKVKAVSLDQFRDENGHSLKDILAAQNEDLTRSIERKTTFEEIINNGFNQPEKEVLLYLTKGYTVREIGRKLNISHVMVLKHKKNLINKWRKKKVTRTG